MNSALNTKYTVNIYIVLILDGQQVLVSNATASTSIGMAGNSSSRAIASGSPSHGGQSSLTTLRSPNLHALGNITIGENFSNSMQDSEGLSLNAKGSSFNYRQNEAIEERWNAYYRDFLLALGEVSKMKFKDYSNFLISNPITDESDYMDSPFKG